MSVVAVLTAAGSGIRLGHALPKALVPVRGEPLVVHAARRLLSATDADGPLVGLLVVTAPAEHVAAFTSALDALPCRVSAAPVDGTPDPADGPTVVVVPGGATRQASVAAGLAVLPAGRPGGSDVVLVHDAARPFAPPELVGRVVDAVRAGHAAVVPGLAVTDTIKRVGVGDRGAEPVVGTVDRAELRAVQTPQGFTLGLLLRAHDEAARHADDETLAATDDAGLVERLGLPVWVVPGDERAAKITTARDLRVAELLGDA